MSDALIAKIKANISACSTLKSVLTTKRKDENTFDVSGMCTRNAGGRNGTQYNVSGTVTSACEKFQLRWSETGTYGANSAPITGTISCIK